MSDHRSARPVGKHLALGLLTLLALFAIAALVWVLAPLGPGAEASAALESDDGLEVAEQPYGYDFRPDDPGPVGVLIYPGGRVDARSYAMLANAVARQGNLAVIVRMPLSLAVLSPNAADKAIEAHPEIERWVLVGHSLGGAMGASYAAEHPSDIRGLVLLAAYPPESSNLRESGIAAANLVGTHDTVVDEPNWTSGADRLPADTETVLIEGGNHAQFGDYGEQPGDSTAAISAAEQQKWTVGAILRVIERAGAQ